MYPVAYHVCRRFDVCFQHMRLHLAIIFMSITSSRDGTCSCVPYITSEPCELCRSLLQLIWNLSLDASLSFLWISIIWITCRACVRDWGRLLKCLWVRSLQKHSCPIMPSGGLRAWDLCITREGILGPLISQITRYSGLVRFWGRGHMAL